MPYVTRDRAGAISAVMRDDPGGAEYLRPGDPELRAFAAAVAPHEDGGFGRLDAEFVRVLEDVIEALTARNVLAITDLPEDAQAKLFERRRFRDRHNANALQLFQATDYGDVI